VTDPQETFDLNNTLLVVTSKVHIAFYGISSQIWSFSTLSPEVDNHQCHKSISMVLLISIILMEEDDYAG